MQIYWISSWLLLQKRSIPPPPQISLYFHAFSRSLMKRRSGVGRGLGHPWLPFLCLRLRNPAFAANQVQAFVIPKVPIRYVKVLDEIGGQAPRHGGERVSSRPTWRADLLEGFVGRFESSRLISMCHSGRKCATQHLLMKHILSESSALGPFTDATWDGKMSARMIYRHFHQKLFWREYCCQWFQYWLVNI